VRIEPFYDRAAFVDDVLSTVKRSLLEGGVVVGLCGADHNVLKINPPLCASMEDAETLAVALDAALAAA
jgi:4-aminobutyrate aminotransferase-like enzyme